MRETGTGYVEGSEPALTCRADARPGGGRRSQGVSWDAMTGSRGDAGVGSPGLSLPRTCSHARAVKGRDELAASGSPWTALRCSADVTRKPCRTEAGTVKMQSRRRRLRRRTLVETHPAAAAQLEEIRQLMPTAEFDAFAARNLSRLTAAAFAPLGSPREDR